MRECTYTFTVRAIENGFTVTVPDYDAIQKKQEEADTRAKKAGDRPYPSDVYTGDCVKMFAAESLERAQDIIETAVKGIPVDGSDAYDKAWREKSA